MPEVLYTSSATAFGGAEAKVQTEDGVINLKTVLPGSHRDEAPETTNPEQLFAAAFAACFDSALQLVSDREQVSLESEVTASVRLTQDENAHGYQLAVDLQVKGQNIDKTNLEELVQKAHELWPYADSKKGNMKMNVHVH